MTGPMRLASLMNIWEQKYQAGEIHWNRGAPSPPLVQWADQHVDLLQGRMVVIGCGVGHDVAYLASKGLEVHGLDIAPTAINMAQQSYPGIPVERWHCADLFSLPPDLRHRFDVVIEHTCLSGMPPELRQSYVQGVLNLLKPEGLVAGVWFIDPELDPGHVGPPFPLPVETLDTLFSGDFAILEDYVPGAAFPGREGRERVRVLRRH